ncbi:MAG TPA: PrsW family intramembrane metalloprotease [Candidatus Yonathbacteria bacterium]|nr:PrsW family intramembrane metalloprotease [Candidatus Yonathbacteria bacterium]
MAGNEIAINTLLWAGVGGFLPALFWLWFWLREDKKRPEPTGLLVLSFIAGILTVFIVFPIEKFAYSIASGTALILSIAFIEEVLKYVAIYTVALRSKYFDEPIDAIVYAITVALGFSAMENFLYIVNLMQDGGTTIGVINGNLRFIGATLLHTVSSAAVGVAIGLSFYKKRFKKIIYLSLGLITAVLLHALFNLFIIKTESIGEILTVFSYLWVLVIILILLFEKIKKIRPTARILKQKPPRR